jgi:hypothetical protein
MFTGKPLASIAIYLYENKILVLLGWGRLAISSLGPSVQSCPTEIVLY